MQVMRTIRLNRDLFSEPCIFTTVIMLVMTLVIVMVLRPSVSELMDDCNTDRFLDNFCNAVQEEKVEGGLCAWMCDESDGNNNRKTLTLCAHNPVHHMHDEVILRGKSNYMFAMSRGFLSNVSHSYDLHTVDELRGATFMHATSTLRQKFSSILNTFLNNGSHDAILNSLKSPSKEPVPAAYVQSMAELLQNKRFILSLLFYGSGDRSMEVHGTATESVPAVSLDFTCAGVYQTFSLINNTTPLSDVLNKSASLWTMGTTINTFHLYEVVLHLLDLEETTSEHEYEGQFYICNLNTSMFLLHNDCVKRTQSESYMLSHPCTLKILDISQILYSKDEVERKLSVIRCTSDTQCRLHSCNGVCSNGRCTATSHTAMSGIVQICRLLSSIEGQLLEEMVEDQLRGRFYYVIDKCLDLQYFPNTAIDSLQHYSRYNTVFQELKGLFFSLHDAKTFKMKDHVELLAAQREAKRQANAAKKRP